MTAMSTQRTQKTRRKLSLGSTKGFFFVSLVSFVSTGFWGPACRERQASAAPSAYLDYSSRDDRLTGGVKLIPITTPKGPFKVWTKRVGNKPRMKVLLLHG